MNATPSHDEPPLYGAHAEYYDAIYHWKRYREESDRLHVLLGDHGVMDGDRVLDAACGTGGHLRFLAEWYEVSGFDRSGAMLDLARVKTPGAHLFEADMTDFAVDEPVGAALCLFSSIGYVYPEERLRACAACFARAVRPGGVVIIEPWLSPAAFTPGHTALHTYDSDDLKLCRVAVGDKREGDLSNINFHWLAARRGTADVEHFEDRHLLWLCPREKQLEVFDAAGFETRFEEDGLMVGRGLVIGRRRVD